jgi:hypothetical protein
MISRSKCRPANSISTPRNPATDQSSLNLTVRECHTGESLHQSPNDLEWIVHRAGIYSDGPSKGSLQRSKRNLSVATFRDCADYNYRTVTDSTAVHTADLSHYE